MVANARVTIKTKRAWPNRIPSIEKDIRGNVGRIVYDFARGVAAEARMRAPVRTGFLKASIKSEKRGPNHHAVVVGAHYGIYVEYGTRHMAAQPFLRPAVESQKAIVRQKLRAGVVTHR